MNTALSRYPEVGYAVLESALSTDDVDRIRAEAVAICRGQRGDFRGLRPAAPGAGDDQVVRDYFCVHLPHKISPVIRDVRRAPGVVSALNRVIGPNVKAMHVGKHDYRDVVLVSGEDPYAYKGVVDRGEPGVRPTGDGGCDW